MAATNDFQIFAGAAGSNVITQAQYLALQALSQGFSTGIASSNQLNKVWRQSSIIGAMIAQFICDYSGQNALDDGTIATLEANFAAALQAVTRQKLTANLNVYVNPNGSDTNNNGLSAGTAFATMQKAWRYIIGSLDLNNFTVIVNVANGTYTTGVVCSGYPLGASGSNSVQFVGNTSSPTSVVVTTTNQHAFTASGGAPLSVAGFSISTSGSVGGVPSIALLANSGSSINLAGSMNFGTCSGQHIWGAGGAIGINSGYTISGGAAAHYSASSGGYVLANVAGTVTLSGTPAFANGFAQAFQLGVIQIASTTITYTGTATGLRYQSAQNSVINTSGAATTYFPGSIAGTTGTGGLYI